MPRWTLLLRLAPLLAVALLLGGRRPAAAPAVYLADFEGPVGREWSATTTERTPTGDRGFLGQFGNEAVTLSLQDLPAHSSLNVSFDLFVIRSWNGQGEEGWGPDRWSLTVEGGPPLLQTSFSVPATGYSWQSYPGDADRDLAGPGTGQSEGGTLGFLYPATGPDRRPTDQVYRLIYNVSHTAPSVLLRFAGDGLEDLANESWGLDNVRVEVRTSPPGRLRASPERLNLAKRRGRITDTTTLTLTNVGRGQLSGNVSVLYYPFHVASGGDRLTLAPGESREVRVTYTPARAGRPTDSLVITSDDPTHPILVVPVEGRTP